MSDRKIKIMLVGFFGPGALECSYYEAFRSVGCEVYCFDIKRAVQKYCRLGKFGQLINQYLTVEPWINKANREMVIEARQFGPNLIVVFGQNQVRAGALAQIRSMLNVLTVYVWPDTLINLNATLIASLPLFDLVATYSQSTIRQFQSLGASRVEFVPLAGDPHMHPVSSHLLSESDSYNADVCFIGQWRPEREQAMTVILSNLPEIEVKIWGPDWGRRCRHNKAILRAWQKRSLYGREFAQAIGASKINVNIIDDTNYPAANMRFFEIPCAGGLQVCSPCPEMANEFRHGETIFYYNNLAELTDLIHTIQKDNEMRLRVAHAATEMLLSAHTYSHRVRQILNSLHLT